MKKMIAVALLVLVTMFAMVGCSASKCDTCGKEGDTKEVTVAGEELNLCEDCAKGAEALNSLGALLG